MIHESSIKIIVKVGKKSDIMFHGAQTFRAVTLDEMIKLTELHPDASIIVIENIKAADVQRATEFIKEFESRNKNNQVYFYTPDNDLETGGIADELEKESYLSKTTLYSAIENNSKVVVTTDISRLKETSADLDNPFDSMWVAPTDEDENKTDSKPEQMVSEVTQTEDTSTASSIEEGRQQESLPGDIPEGVSNVIDETNAEPEVKAEPEEQAEPKAETKAGAEPEVQPDFNDAASSIDETQPVDQGTADTPIKQVKNKKDKEKAANLESKGSGANQELLDKAMGELREANKQLAQTKTEIAKLKLDLASATSRGDKLSELVQAVEHERDTFQDKLKIYGSSEVFEEPITLAEYQDMEQRLKALSEQANAPISSDQLDELNEKLKKAEESASIARRNLDDYKGKLRESTSKLSEIETSLSGKQEELDNKQSEISRLEGEVAKLQGEIRDHENSKLEASNQSAIEITELKSSISKLEAQITELRGSIEAERMRANAIQYQLDQSNNINDQLQSRVNQEVKAKMIVIGILSDAVMEIKSQINSSGSSNAIIDSLKASIKQLEDSNKKSLAKIAEYEQKMLTLSSAEATISALRSEKERLAAESAAKQREVIQLQTTITSNNSKISELELKLGGVASQIELAKSQVRGEAESAKREANELRQSLELMKKQFKDKSDQYEALVQQSGVSETGVSSLLETNRVREEYNKQLIEQVAKLSSELETARKEATVAKQTATALEDSNRSMRANMESLSSLVGNRGVTKLKPIKYTSRGMVIPVFGSGSYGITTTAMSLANRLSAQARVLYIDFDMVSPKADGWFRKSPFLTQMMGLDGMPQQAKTGLGILVEKQIQFFMSNFEQLIIRASMTKSGCIDYLSGFMVRPESNKVLATDWSAFMNVCGNKYGYVIIDMGSIGSSDISDQLIKELVSSSYRSILVSTIDLFEVNQLAMKLGRLGVDRSKLAWLVNMCKNTKMDDRIKKLMHPIPYFMMMFKPELYGMKLNFTNDNLLRDKFHLFLDELVFPKR